MIFMKKLFNNANYNFLKVFVVLAVILVAISYLNFKIDAIVVSIILADVVTDIGLGRDGTIQMNTSEKIANSINFIATKTIDGLIAFCRSSKNITQRKIQQHKANKRQH